MTTPDDDVKQAARELFDRSCILMVGNICDGYRAVGPFETFDDAAEYDLKYHEGGNWVLRLSAPVTEE